MAKLTLISTPTCPFVQRAVIALKEKGAPFEVVYVDLADRPEWFVALSPLGKVPVLKVERPGQPDAVIFESAVIVEYLEETVEGAKLHPADPLDRAQHRSWVEYGSAVLGDLFKLVSAKDEDEVAKARGAVRQKLARLEAIVAEPFFAGEQFSVVDAVFAPAFRQIATVQSVADVGVLEGFPRLQAWSAALLSRPSVRDAVPEDFAARYLGRLEKMGSHLLKVAA
jgi:glutathione S-transferase